MRTLPENWQLALAGWLTSTLLGLVGIVVSLGNRQQRAWLTALCIIFGAASVILFFLAFSKSVRLLRRSPLSIGPITRVRVGIHSSRWAVSDRDVYDAHAFFTSLLPPEVLLDQSNCPRVLHMETSK